MQIIAVAGHDKRVRRRLDQLNLASPVSLRVLGWTDDIAGLMHSASVLVTKPGGLTIAEAALSALPTVFFDPIPGAEFVNAKRMVEAGAARITSGAKETAETVVSLLTNVSQQQTMSSGALSMSRPEAGKTIAQLILRLSLNR